MFLKKAMSAAIAYGNIISLHTLLLLGIFKIFSLMAVDTDEFRKTPPSLTLPLLPKLMYIKL